MIIRVFRARIRAGHVAEHEALMREVSIPLMERQAGLLACYTGRPAGSNTDEYVMVSLWRDIASIQTFVGDDWEQPVIPDEREVAIIAETSVDHYEAFDEIVSGTGKYLDSSDVKAEHRGGVQDAKAGGRLPSP